MKNWVLCILVMLFETNIHGQPGVAPKPLFDDPVEHGAADPVVIYNKQEKMWWMFYTNRRALLNDPTGVAWVHGTRIGIAESKDGRIWKYKDTANINYRVDPGYTFWAPDIIEHEGLYHMYLTYVPGTFQDWQHPREIVHLTSTDLRNWKFEAVVPLTSHNVIDACIIKIAERQWRMWYNDEKNGKTIYYADSKDLYNWTEKELVIPSKGEGPKVFRWQNKYFMIVDVWRGMEVYSSDDLSTWTRQPERILEHPGKGIDDQAIGGHCDVVVDKDKAYVFYFTHPGRTKDTPSAKGSFEDRRSVIQLGQLHYSNGVITCDRDEPVRIQL